MHDMQKTLFLYASLAIMVMITSSCAQAEVKTTRSYFSASAFRDLESFDADIPVQFSALLSTADEPVLEKSRSAKFALRLSIRSAFSGSLVIRVEQAENGTAAVHITRLGSTPAMNDVVLEHRMDNLTAADLEKLRRAVEQNDFWTTGNRQDTIGSDGSDWLLEVKDGARYHVAYKWWPFSGSIFEIGMVLMRITHVDFKDR